MKTVLCFILMMACYEIICEARCSITSLNDSHLSFTTEREFYTEGERMNISCEEGYMVPRDLVPKQHLRCGEDGSWNISDLPPCIRIACYLHKFRRPNDHMIVTPSKERFFLHESPSISCETGYHFRGGDPVCGERGWIFPGMMFFCDVSFTCKLPIVPHATPHIQKWSPSWDGKTLEYHERVAFECDKGYRIRNLSHVTCGLDGEFEQNINQTICEEKTCDAESILQPHMIITPPKEAFRLNETASISCAEGYFLRGSNPTCEENGWAIPGMMFSCDANTCILPTILHATAHLDKAHDNFRGELFEYKDRVWFECNKGYIIRNLSEVTCGADGELQQNIEEVICEVIRCPRPYLSEKLNITNYKETYRYNEEIHFRCEAGLPLRGITSAVCGDFNRFNITMLPTCEEDALIMNHFTVSSITIGASVGSSVALMLLLFGMVVCLRKHCTKEFNYEKTNIALNEQHQYTDIIHHQTREPAHDSEPAYMSITDESVSSPSHN